MNVLDSTIHYVHLMQHPLQVNCRDILSNQQLDPSQKDYHLVKYSQMGVKIDYLLVEKIHVNKGLTYSS